MTDTAPLQLVFVTPTRTTHPPPLQVEPLGHE
jgi:hypothetical protein